MNRHLRLLIGAAGIVAGASLLAPDDAPARRASACEDQRFPALRSPDGAHRAIVFRRVCGAATPIRTHVSVLAGDDEPTGDGNVFTMEVAPRRGGVDYDFEVLWTGADRLLIRHLPDARVLRAERRGGRVRVEYRGWR